MTQRLLQHPDRHDVAARPPTARVQLKPPTPATGCVDGAWWPRSLDLRAETPELLGAVSSRLGPIARVLYHLDGWGTAPKRITDRGRLVKLDGYRYQPVHTVCVLGINRSRLVLLVVPPDTDPGSAHAAMTTAATADNTSTSDDLLPTDAMDRLTEAPAAQSIWDDDGGAFDLYPTFVPDTTQRSSAS